jgi:hypothetical protein
LLDLGEYIQENIWAGPRRSVYQNIDDTQTVDDTNAIDEELWNPLRVIFHNNIDKIIIESSKEWKD